MRSTVVEGAGETIDVRDGQPDGAKTAVAAPTPNIRKSDITFTHVVVVLASALVGVIVTLWAAFDRWPFSGLDAQWVGYPLAALAHGCLAALLVGSYIELHHQSWTYFGAFQHWVLAICTIAMLAIIGLVDWWVVQLDLGFGPTFAYFGVSAVAALAMAIGTVWLMGGFAGTGSQALGVGLLAGFGGFIAGVVTMVAVIFGLAYLRQIDRSATATVPVVHGIRGEYVALGDSYSAGEGLRPFDPGTGSPGAGEGDGCNRSAFAYSQWLVFDSPQPAERFVACSGAVTPDIQSGFEKQGKDRDGNDATISVDPQLDGQVHPEVGLVTITIGGNDVLFSKIVVHCAAQPDCLDQEFDPGTLDAGHATNMVLPPAQPLVTWAPQAATSLAVRTASIYGALRQQFPNARVLVIGYPYLFPAGPAKLPPNDCASVLRRFSQTEREGIRALMDQFNDMLYAQAIAAGIEFVSPAAVYDGHEPCGSKGQYTNSIKPIVSYPNPIDGGTFHPNKKGQQALAALVACYIDTNQTPPMAFTAGHPTTVQVHGLVTDLSALGLVDAPGSYAAPLACDGVR